MALIYENPTIHGFWNPRCLGHFEIKFIILAFGWSFVACSIDSQAPLVPGVE